MMDRDHLLALGEAFFLLLFFLDHLRTRILFTY